MKEVFTEEEVIKITIEHGYDGSEFETAAWKQRGCLKTDRTYKGLISKLETIYDNVEVTGKGKKRQYSLMDKKEIVTERQFNYKGKVISPEDLIMKEYIFNQLIKKDGMNYSYSVWAKELGFVDLSEFEVKDMIQKIKDLHYGNNVIYNPKEIVSQFIKLMNERNKAVVKMAFKRLEKQNRVKVTATYHAKEFDGTMKEIEQEEYEVIQEDIKNCVESHGVSFYTYSQTFDAVHKSKKMKEIIHKVRDYIDEAWGIEYAFKSFKVEVLNDEVQTEVSKDEFEQAYIQRLIKLTKDRQQKDSYKTSISYWKRFYYLNTLTLLAYIGADGVNETLKEELKLKPTKQEEYELDYMIYCFERDIEKENRRHTFGKMEETILSTTQSIK